MNITKVIEELKQKYPGKRIVLNNRNNCTEILCEIEPTSEHPTYSKAISVIDNTDPHFHNNSTEKYTVIKGKLTIVIDSKSEELSEGKSVTILPGQTHSAIGSETWILCESRPGWVQKDHHTIKSP